MHTYTLHYSKISNSIFLFEWEVKNGKHEQLRNRSEFFSFAIIDQHPVKEFYNLVETGKNKIVFKGIIFNIEKCDQENTVSFTSVSDFCTVARTLLRFKNKYKISVSINKEQCESFDLHCFLKIEYVPHLDKPKDDFLVIRNFYLNTIKVTKSFKTNKLFEMIMKFRCGVEEYEGVFLDLDGDTDLNIEIGRNTFFNVYTDKTIEELDDFFDLSRKADEGRNTL